MGAIGTKEMHMWRHQCLGFLPSQQNERFTPLVVVMQMLGAICYYYV
jgi:hypothetical protein